MGHLPFFTCFSKEFTANLRYSLINTAFTRFFPHPPLNKVEVLSECKICKKCLTCNIQHCSGGRGVNLNYIFLNWNTQCPKRFEQDCRNTYMKGKPFVNRRYNTKGVPFLSIGIQKVKALYLGAEPPSTKIC